MKLSFNVDGATSVEATGTIRVPVVIDPEPDRQWFDEMSQVVKTYNRTVKERRKESWNDPICIIEVNEDEVALIVIPEHHASVGLPLLREQLNLFQNMSAQQNQTNHERSVAFANAEREMSAARARLPSLVEKIKSFKSI